MDGIPTAPKQTGLRSGLVERNAECKYLPSSHKRSGANYVLRFDVVQGSDLIVAAPPPPVRQLVGGFVDRLPADIDCHAFPSSWIDQLGTSQSDWLERYILGALDRQYFTHMVWRSVRKSGTFD